MLREEVPVKWEKQRAMLGFMPLASADVADWRLLTVAR